MVSKVKTLENCEQNRLQLKNKNRKIDISFDSAHCASSIKMGAKLKEERGRGGLRILPLGKTP